MAVDPKKAADPEVTPGADEALADTDESPAQTQDEGQDQPDQDEPAYLTALREDLAAARADAKEAREYARRAQGTSDKTASRLEKDVARLSGMLTKALTVNMTADERASFERDAELERLREERSTPKEDDPNLREWQSFASRALEKSGIKHDDPRLVEAFNKHVEGSQNPTDWPVALAAAIADVKGGDAEKVRTDVQKEREQERVKARNETRRSEGKIDRSSPSGQARVRVDDMTDEEFDRHWEQQKAVAARRASQGTAAG